MEMPRGFKGVWIPKEIWLNSELTLVEKVLIAEIDSLDTRGGCFASNQHFSRFLGVTVVQVSRIISKMKTRGFIEVKQENIKGRTRRTIKSALTLMIRRSGKAPYHFGHERLDINVKASIEKQIESVNTAPGAGAEPQIPDVIKAFEAVDPKNKTYYGNRTQRSAVAFLLAEYGLAKVLARIAVLPRTNGLPYFPKINSPHELKEKWVKLEDAVKSRMAEAQLFGDKYKIAFA